MRSNVNLFTLGRFCLALCLAICLVVAGTVGPANQAYAEGGGNDTIIAIDTILGGSPAEGPTTTEASSLASGGGEAAPSTTEEAVKQWASKLSWLLWTPLIP